MSSWQKYVHLVLFNCLGGLSLPRKSVVGLTDHPHITIAVYHGRKTTIQRKLENVFMKHYAPNHMPDPKGEWTLKENNSELHHGIYSKVNQFIYTLVCNYLSNIRILAKVILQIFRSQRCSYTKCLCPENGSNSTENLRNVLKS